MPFEVEQKYRLPDPDVILALLTALGAVAQQTVTQLDTYYAHPARDFATTDEALRIRRVGSAEVAKNCITYKGPKLDAATKTRREIELPLAVGEQSVTQWDELLVALSFRRVAEVSKSRQIFHLQRDGQTIELAVDNVQDVGDFIELEIVVANEAEIAPAQQKIATLASELQLEGAQRRSYLEMLLEN
ncbi:MAG: class IV adenylate cyclase [Planctomycetes bacterium]|nr:class IV adenylate cyclase [Planctomycetota bacterium]